MTCADMILDELAGCPIELPVILGPFEKLTEIRHLSERGALCKEVIDSIALTLPGLTRGMRN